MNLPPFVLIEHPIELKDKILILQTAPPYLVGQVWKFTNHPERVRFQTRFNPDVPMAEMREYEILITLYTALNTPRAKDMDHRDAAQVLAEMLEFYSTVRIERNAARYKRYHIDQADPGRPRRADEE